jgi:hypothetical protein
MDFCNIEEWIRIKYSWLFVRTFYWGRFDEYSALEVSRKKADIPPEKGGPTVVFRDGGLQFCRGLPPKVYTTGNCLDSDGSVKFETLEDNLASLSPSYVACSGISRQDFESICSR